LLSARLWRARRFSGLPRVRLSQKRHYNALQRVRTVVRQQLVPVLRFLRSQALGVRAEAELVRLFRRGLVAGGIRVKGQHNAAPGQGLR
jgi:hypothetical protein